MSNWNNALIPDIRRDLFGWRYQLHRVMKTDPDDKEDIKRHIGGFMETYIILKRAQGLWKKEWDAKCEYAKQKYLYRVVTDV